MREASHWAKGAGKSTIDAPEIQAAIDRRIRRMSRLRDRFQEEILENTLMIDSSGAHIGQVNGLAVLQIGEFTFAKPSRITARVALGSGKVVDIERETELGGPLHSKGVLILSGYLAARFASDVPLSLSASIVMEQSYGGVEGDSASSAELYALLSALAGVPLHQSLAVTGSVDQHGNVQAIGGVNEKIEGFFDICRARGLTGDQGVIIPAPNVRHLMLRRDVVEAAEAGKFHIFAVRTIDEGIALLSGMPAGEADENQEYPAGTFNRRVHDRIVTFAERRKAFARDAKVDVGEAAKDH
jgi:predicted ATP-dependent protease